ncbi:ABC transporter substrate-binding protein [Nocardioides sp. zg-536]|uniref:ABC transporter substrate-binding protein n=1 Tax=Nocardioides faecalis TaxID=2803858 RepID=A0A938YA68_9ACTN|nr:ABC transporter substrate-binding protein [Nocardioides faecalis]MBM9460114.1 ABC transporter substrate-binding protein [Nocardioides faecalis]MBS4754213.1 ABC transporter substrate-binding protein [Nocardioides faecalis]QVI60093.1 ABC transporter substrate-binding protein [Nocardioides faecalis]
MTRHRVAAALLATTLLAAGCAGSDGSGGEKTPSSLSKEEIYAAGLVGEQQAGDPVDGGTLTLADYSEARSLDPTKTIPNGAAGGNALAAVYDVLVRYDQESNSFQPWLAESLTSDDDTTWTLKLRQEAAFSDGTPLDANAVVGSVGYYMENAGYNTLLLATNIKDMKPQGDDTVVFTLHKPWSTFPNMLASGPGMIMAPAAYRGGPDKFTPIGAGPFILDEYKPAEELVLKANPDYWNGKPHLDSVRFVWLASDDDRVKSLADGTVDAANIRAPQALEKARKDGFRGLMFPNGVGSIYWLNNREGRAASDVRVRQAINYAIDPEAVAQRVNGGAGLPGRNIYSPTAPYFAEVETADFDREKATALLEEAQADGYDGKLTYIGQSDQASQTQAVTIEAMLEAVGFEVELDLLRNIADQTERIYVTHDYDIAVAGMSIPDEDPYSRLATNLNSKSPQNPSGYANPEMDALLDKLQAASGEESTDLLKQINELWQETIPGVAMGAGAFFIPWNDNVAGVQATSETLLLLGDAWKS